MNAVGCGPVAAAMLLYHWAQQGYGRLVDDFLAAWATVRTTSSTTGSSS